MQSLMYLIESKLSTAETWAPWPHLVPLSSRGDAIRLAAHLSACEPKPTRFASTVREFRAREVKTGCPACFSDVEAGELCQWHAEKTARGIPVPPPVPMPERKPVRMSPRVRRSPHSGFGPKAVAVLRAHHTGGAE